MFRFTAGLKSTAARKMLLLLCIFILGLAAILPLSSHAGGLGKTKTYTGEWFTIHYPQGFTVRTGQRSGTSTSGYDSAYFRAPNGVVEFYVFSPQWSGESKYLHIDPHREVLISQKRTQTVKNGSSTEVEWVTVQAKDKSYSRSWMDTQTTSTRLVFGIRYRDARALATYRRQYRAFKASLQQFAD